MHCSRSNLIDHSMDAQNLWRRNEEIYHIITWHKSLNNYQVIHRWMYLAVWLSIALRNSNLNTFLVPNGCRDGKVGSMKQSNKIFFFCYWRNGVFGYLLLSSSRSINDALYWKYGFHLLHFSIGMIRWVKRCYSVLRGQIGITWPLRDIYTH